MLNKLAVILTIIAALLLSACQASSFSSTPSPSPAYFLPTPTPLVAPDASTTSFVTCADIDANWGNHWPAVLEALDQLIVANQSCGPEPLLSKKYATHFNYGASLEDQGDLNTALTQYQAAFAIDPQRRPALEALLRLEALPRPTPVTCLADGPASPGSLSATPLQPSQLITIEEAMFRLEGRPLAIKGVNYFPRHAPWTRFFNEANPAWMADEFTVMKEAGFNTVRIFLWYEPLFTCQPEDAIPNEAAFGLVDTMFRLAAERGLKLIVALNDTPDLYFRPLYTDYAHYDAQTAYIVQRYRHEPALLAWDVRNALDEDVASAQERFDDEAVKAWLAHITRLIRRHDPYHLVTATTAGDPSFTAPYVDFLSFQHWDTPAALAERLQSYRNQDQSPQRNSSSRPAFSNRDRDRPVLIPTPTPEPLSKPLVVMAFGEHSWPNFADSPQTEETQAAYLSQLVEVAQENQAGWLIWTAFDFAPPPGLPPNQNDFFGLWRLDLSSKPILQELPLP